MRASRRRERSILLLQDAEIVRRVCAGESDLFEILLRRYNQRLYRVARGVLRDDTEAEDVVQETWFRAFSHLSQLSEPARFATWISRIAIYEAWARARRGRRIRPGAIDDLPEEIPGRPASPDPERAASDHQINGFLEAAIDALPEKYRLVFVLREVEGLSTAEVASALHLTQVTVKTRFHRARKLLRADLLARAEPLAGAFQFLGSRCEKLRTVVMARLLESAPVLAAPGA